MTAVLRLLVVSLLLWMVLTTEVRAVREDDAFHYNATEALGAWYFSKTCSCAAESVIAWNCSICTEFHPQFEIYGRHANLTVDTLAYSGYDRASQRVVVVFRGTRGINWLWDLDFTPVPFLAGACGDECMVHWGFLALWHSLRAMVLVSVRQILRDHPEATGFLTTGHSLGAALSVLAAAEIALTFVHDANAPARTVSTINFGEPRVGNTAFATFVATKVMTFGRQWRIVHMSDPVPHLPLQIMGFQHAPHELWFRNNGSTSFTMCFDNATSEDPSCSDSIPLWDWNPQDHNWYLGVMHGCNDTPEEQERMLASMPAKNSREWVRFLWRLTEASAIAKQGASR